MRADVVTDLLGPGAEVEGETSGDGGARTWWVRSATGASLVVKVADASGPSLVRSARALEIAARVGVPVPRVVDAGTRDGRQHLVTERVAARSWHEVAPTLDPADRASVLGDLAEVLERLRDATLPEFGELDTSGTGGGGRSGTPPSELVALRTRTRARTADPARAAVADATLTRHAAAFTGAAPVLVHGDLHHANVLVRRGSGRWRVAAVVDWDSAWAGPADADGARAALWDHMPGDPGPADVREAVHQLLWALEYPATTPRHRADLGRLLSHLGLGRTG